jgi:hypothetical protein
VGRKALRAWRPQYVRVLSKAAGADFDIAEAERKLGARGHPSGGMMFENLPTLLFLVLVGLLIYRRVRRRPT